MDIPFVNFGLVYCVSGCDQTKLKPTKVFKIEAMHKILYYLGWLWIVTENEYR